MVIKASFSTAVAGTGDGLSEGDRNTQRCQWETCEKVGLQVGAGFVILLLNCSYMKCFCILSVVEYSA